MDAGQPQRRRRVRLRLGRLWLRLSLLAKHPVVSLANRFQQRTTHRVQPNGNRLLPCIDMQQRPALLRVVACAKTWPAHKITQPQRAWRSTSPKGHFQRKQLRH